MSGKSASDYERDYTRPNLRERLKEEIKEAPKGGRRGQWSARKSQLLAQAYEQEGGRYKGKKTDSQRSLAQWTAQDWQTVDAKGRARRSGEMHRYLPAKVWRMLSPSERKQAERTKLETDSRGRQVARWPKAVERAMTAAGHTHDEPGSVPQQALRAYARRLGADVSSGATKQALTKAIKTARASGKQRSGASEPSKQALYDKAQRLDIPGRSRMNKRELQRAIDARTH